MIYIIILAIFMKGGPTIAKALVLAVSGGGHDQADGTITEIVAGVRKRLVNGRSQVTIDRFRDLARSLLEMADTTKLEPIRATPEQGKSKEVIAFLKQCMPSGEYTDMNKFWGYAQEWNSAVRADGKTLAETHGYTLPENVWTLRYVFGTNSLKKVLGGFGFEKEGYTDVTSLKDALSDFQEQWESSKGETLWEKFENFLETSVIDQNIPKKRIYLLKYFQPIVTEGKRVSIEKIVAYLGLRLTEASVSGIDFPLFAEQLRGHSMYTQILNGINDWDGIVKICIDINSTIEKGGKKMPTTKAKIIELCKNYDVRYKDQKVTFDTLIRLLNQSEESKKTAPKEGTTSTTQEQKTREIPTFPTVTPPQIGNLRQAIERVVSGLSRETERKEYTKQCRRNNGGTSELSLPNGTKEEITAYFLEKQEGTPRWQTLLSPIAKEEDQTLGIRKLALKLNTSFEESEMRGFFFPSTLALYEEIFELPNRTEDYTINDIITAISGVRSPSEKRKPGRPPGSGTKSASPSSAGVLSKEDKEARVNTGRSVFRRDLGLIAGEELESTLLVGASYEIDVGKKTILFTTSPEESASMKTTKIWGEILTTDGLKALKDKGYIYNQNNSLLSITLSGWTYAMIVPRIRSNGKAQSPVAKIDFSGDAIKKVQEQVTEARSEFQVMINDIIGAYYNRVASNNASHLPPKTLLKIDFTSGLSTDVDARKQTITIHYNHGHDSNLNLAKDILRSLQPRAFEGCIISGGAGEKRVLEYTAKNGWKIFFRLNY